MPGVAGAGAGEEDRERARARVQHREHHVGVLEVCRGLVRFGDRLLCVGDGLAGDDDIADQRHADGAAVGDALFALGFSPHCRQIVNGNPGNSSPSPPTRVSPVSYIY